MSQAHECMYNGMYCEIMVKIIRFNCPKSIWAAYSLVDCTYKTLKSVKHKIWLYTEFVLLKMLPKIDILIYPSYAQQVLKIRRIYPSIAYKGLKNVWDWNYPHSTFCSLKTLSNLLIQHPAPILHILFPNEMKYFRRARLSKICST